MGENMNLRDLKQEIKKKVLDGYDLRTNFSSNDFLQTLTVLGGTAATGAQVTPTGVYLIWYDKCASTMQLLTVAP